MSDRHQRHANLNLGNSTTVEVQNLAYRWNLSSGIIIGVIADKPRPRTKPWADNRDLRREENLENRRGGK